MTDIKRTMFAKRWTLSGKCPPKSGNCPPEIEIEKETEKEIELYIEKKIPLSR